MDVLGQLDLDPRNRLGYLIIRKQVGREDQLDVRLKQLVLMD